jgi:DNA-binding IclR family transcriptional regulator
LRKVVELTGESSALNRLNGDVAEVIATVGGQQRLSTTMRLGDVAPLYATSGGKAILAMMPASWITDYFSRTEFQRITPTTICDSSAMMKQVEVIRKKGFAYSFNEYTPGITGIGKAILDPEGRPLASINVTIPSARYTDTVREEVEAAINGAVNALERAQKRSR